MAVGSGNRAKSSGMKDALGLMAVIFSIVFLFYLLIENYMGYTVIKNLFNKPTKSFSGKVNTDSSK